MPPKSASEEGSASREIHLDLLPGGWESVCWEEGMPQEGVCHLSPSRVVAATAAVGTHPT